MHPAGDTVMKRYSMPDVFVFMVSSAGAGRAETEGRPLTWKTRIRGQHHARDG